MVCKNSMLVYKRALMIICCSFLWGCAEKSVGINTVSYSAAQVKTLRLLPDYQAATSFFAKGDKEGAKRLLEALLHRTGLSAVEREYLIGQVALCDKTQPPASPATALGKMPSLSSSRSGACGPRALLLAAHELGKEGSLAQLTQAAHATVEGTSLAGLRAAAKNLGLRARGVQLDREALAQLHTPAVAWWQGNHFVAVLKVRQSAWDGTQTATIHDPNEKEARSVPLDTLLAQSGGILLVLTR
jgi:Peptidase C39 family